MFGFNSFLENLGLDPSRIRILRHDPRSVAAWRHGGKQAFGCFASFQKQANSPYKGADAACHFLPGPTLSDGNASALFFGTTRIIDRWQWDEVRMPLLCDANIIETERGRRDIDAFDLEWFEAGHGYSERLLVNWGMGTRAWSQRAHRQSKEIVEIRLQVQEPPFPGFSSFQARICEIPTFPASWIGALEGVKGTYLLVTDQGEQYVGSAYGARGFIERWRSYLANGNGGNVLLRERGHRDYHVCILEVASPDMAVADIIARETFWKAKLGSRAFGLNAN